MRSWILNWYWFVFSLIIFVGAAMLYLRYTPKVYDVSAKFLLRQDGNSRSRSNSVLSSATMGVVSNSEGLENEMEVLRSVSVAEETIRNLKLYVTYTLEGTVTDKPMYGNNPVTVDLDEKHLNELKGSISLVISRNDDGTCQIATTFGSKTVNNKGKLPMTIHTPMGNITVDENPAGAWTQGRDLLVTIVNPKDVATGYASSLSAERLSEGTTIAVLSRNDIIPERSIDYLRELVRVYNRQANDDKNEVARRTEEFINQRLEKINNELGNTDGAIEEYKKDNHIASTEGEGSSAMSQTDNTDNELMNMNTQMMLLESIRDYMRMPENQYQSLPSNVGLTDPAATALIAQYNDLALERNRLLRYASEKSPAVVTITGQLDDLVSSINRAISQAYRSLDIERQAIMNKYEKYSNLLARGPEQERVLTEIGRQQTVKSSLYIMLLQKREENSISLASTADKGRLIDDPMCCGVVAPQSTKILACAFGIGIFLPFILLVLAEIRRHRIEGHADVERLTHLPIIADVAIANESGKTKGDIVVHENENNQMEEIFRGMRTNLQFMLKENENVIMFTSSTSGEGKTFTAGNLAVSFALLGKKVLLVGLDIRRPRLAQLFELRDRDHGITPLLVKDSITTEDVREQIVASDINDNLDILLAGPVTPNPGELVSRKALDDIFSILRNEYDYVIVDTAPVGLVTDTLHIGRVANVCVAICRADYTEKSGIRMFNSFADANKLPNVCIAINGIDMSTKKYGYDYGYGKYGRYGKYGYKNGYSGYGGSYGYHTYGYGAYSDSHYGSENDNSVKKK